VTTEGENAAPTPPRRSAWLRAASDRVPTKWFAGIATALFLGATAAFGGLATAAEPEIAALEPGQEHRNDQLAITVERAVLVDELPDAGVYPEDDERVLALIVHVENQWTEPLSASPDSSLLDSLVLEELAETPPDSVARYDDATFSPRLQPGVPVKLVVTWAVDADRFMDGQKLQITLNDMTLHTGSFVANGQWWTEPVAAATLTVPLDDIGAGV
jgi:hypothetical protein